MAKILGIESSCDECAAAIIEDERKICSNVIHSQIETHKAYGGVVPEIASREHLEVIDRVVDRAFKEAQLSMEDIDAIAVTRGPGLVGSLLVGISYAKGLSLATGKPLIGVHHLAGHIASVKLAFEDIQAPYIALVLSGGHSHFYKIDDKNSTTCIGQTRDDALGEAFDKVARMLSLNYPGGPELEKLAKKGKPIYPFTKTLLEDDSLDFSFSGLKSNIMQYLQKNEWRAADVAASFQENVFDVVATKIERATKQTGIQDVIIVGGVSANMRLREVLTERGLHVKFPPLWLCTDNAAMIASAAFNSYHEQKFNDLSMDAIPSFGLNLC